MKTITYDETKFRLVPVEPTEKMIVELMCTGLRHAEYAEGRSPTVKEMAQGYGFMLAAAPQPECAEQTVTPDHGWLSMEHAPTDGTVIQLLVRKDQLPECIDGEEDGDLTRAIGFNNLDHDQEDQWHVTGWSWTHDCFTDVVGTGITPVGWLPLAPLPAAQEPSHDDQ